MKKKELNSYLKRSDILIEGSTATWNISSSGSVNGTYLGTFRFKCFLTPSEKIAAGRDYRELLGQFGSNAPQVEDNLAFSLTQLKYRIISAPPFWTSALGLTGIPGDLPDENIISVVLEAAVASEVKYLAQLEKQKEELLKGARQAAEKVLSQKDAQEEDSEEQAD